MYHLDFPTIDEIVSAMSETPLGEGEEAKVYKIHTNPKYTVRVSHYAPSLPKLHQQLKEIDFTHQKDAFAGRNYAQPIAYWGNDERVNDGALITINLYAPGFSLEVHKAGRPKPEPEEALIKTRIFSETVANMSDKAIDYLYDDMHFLSSREHCIDTGGGLFCNTGNILYSAVDEQAFIIDIQPFIRQHPGINNNHYKGFNTPIYLHKGLIPGAYCYANEHSKDDALIKLRTEITDNVIRGAVRNNLNDIGGYLSGGADKMAKFWEVQLTKLHIPEKYREGFIKDIVSVEQKNRYEKPGYPVAFRRVAGRGMDQIFIILNGTEKILP